MADQDSLETEFSLEKSLETLQSIIGQMQQGVGNFDEQMELFKQGMKLIEDSRAYLKEADMQITQLIDGVPQPMKEPGE